MPRRLKNLRITEVSGVDKGAGEGVRVVLMKRAEEEEPMSTIVDVIKSLTTMSDTNFAAGMSATIEKRALSRDQCFALLKARAEALRQGGESDATAFAKAYCGLSPRIPGGPALIALFNKLEKAMHSVEEQAGSQRHVAPKPVPSWPSPTRPRTTSAPTSAAQAGSENAPSDTRSPRRGRNPAEDDDDDDDLDTMVTKEMRERKISKSAAYTEVLKSERGRELLQRDLARSRRANSAA
jgi:hypothetical protein